MYWDNEYVTEKELEKMEGKLRKLYTLTLTREERKAIQWIGHRYFHGTELRDLIENLNTESWYSEETLTYIIPENTAWLIVDGLESEDVFGTCLSADFRQKLKDFCEGVE